MCAGRKNNIILYKEEPLKEKYVRCEHNDEGNANDYLKKSYSRKKEL
jgi:hypothetical protein